MVQVSALWAMVALAMLPATFAVGAWDDPANAKQVLHVVKRIEVDSQGRYVESTRTIRERSGDPRGPQGPVSQSSETFETQAWDEVTPGGHYYAAFSFGSGYLERAGSALEVSTLKPARAVVTGHDGYLSVKHRKVGGRYLTTVTLLRDAYFKVIDEGDEPRFVVDPVPGVWISTVSSWRDLGRSLSAAYERSEVKTLTPDLQNLVRELPEQGGFYDTIDYVAASLRLTLKRWPGESEVAEIARPTSIADIVLNGYRASADFALVLAAALRIKGMEVDLAVIERGDGEWIDPPLPGLFVDPYIVLKVSSGSGLVAWIDPADRYLKSKWIEPEVAGRHALMLDGLRSRREKLPEATPSDARSQTSVVYEFNAEGRADISMQRKFYGRIAATVAAFIDVSTADRVRRELLGYVVRLDRGVTTSGNLPRKEERVFSDDLSVTLTARDVAVLSQKGDHRTFYVPHQLEDVVDADFSTDVEDLDLVSPSRYDIKMVLKGANLAQTEISCAIDSRWVSASRKVSQSGRDISIRQKFVFKLGSIANGDLWTMEFAELQRGVRDCFGGGPIKL